MARAHDADNLVTTDQDFDAYRATDATTYTSPGPTDELDRLSIVNG